MFESHHQLQKKREQVADLLSFFQRCLPLRARDVDFISDVHCVSDVTPYGVVGKHLITLRQRRKTSLCDSTTSHRRSRYITNRCKQLHTLQKKRSLFSTMFAPTGNVTSGRVFESHRKLQKKARSQERAFLMKFAFWRMKFGFTK